MFRRIAILSLTDKLSNTFLVLVPSLPYLTRVCLWIKLKLLFLKPRNNTLWCGLDKWTTFLRSLDQFLTNIKLTNESSKESITFIDMYVSFKNNRIITDFYIKSADRHQYLNYLPAQPNHIKRSAVFSQTLRISRLCSYEERFI